jgi:hypothetical protein
MWTLMLLLACTGSDDDANDERCNPGGDPTLSLGYGATTYTSFADLDHEAVLIQGPQGGYHLEIALEGTDLVMAEGLASQIVGRSGEDEVASVSPWLFFQCNPETDTWQAFGNQLIFFSDEPTDTVGLDVDITADVTDADGNQAQATATVLIVE